MRTYTRAHTSTTQKHRWLSGMSASWTGYWLVQFNSVAPKSARLLSLRGKCSCASCHSLSKSCLMALFMDSSSSSLFWGMYNSSLSSGAKSLLKSVVGNEGDILTSESAGAGFRFNGRLFLVELHVILLFWSNCVCASSHCISKSCVMLVLMDSRSSSVFWGTYNTSLSSQDDGLESESRTDEVWNIFTNPDFIDRFLLFLNLLLLLFFFVSTLAWRLDPISSCSLGFFHHSTSRLSWYDLPVDFTHTNNASEFPPFQFDWQVFPRDPLMLWLWVLKRERWVERFLKFLTLRGVSPTFLILRINFVLLDKWLFGIVIVCLCLTIKSRLLYSFKMCSSYLLKHQLELLWVRVDQTASCLWMRTADVRVAKSIAKNTFMSSYIFRSMHEI